jgi:isopentenyldiphosphate isomerase
MPRFFNRIVALLVIPCLLGDPGLCQPSLLKNPPKPIPPITALFTQQAVVQALGSERAPIEPFTHAMIRLRQAISRGKRTPTAPQRRALVKSLIAVVFTSALDRSSLIAQDSEGELLRKIKKAVMDIGKLPTFDNVLRYTILVDDAVNQHAITPEKILFALSANAAEKRLSKKYGIYFADVSGRSAGEEERLNKLDILLAALPESHRVCINSIVLHDGLKKELTLQSIQGTTILTQYPDARSPLAHEIGHAVDFSRKSPLKEEARARFEDHANRIFAKKDPALIYLSNPNRASDVTNPKQLFAEMYGGWLDADYAGLLAFAQNSEDASELLQILAPIFIQDGKLRVYLKSADPLNSRPYVDTSIGPPGALDLNGLIQAISSAAHPGRVQMFGGSAKKILTMELAKWFGKPESEWPEDLKPLFSTGIHLTNDPALFKARRVPGERWLLLPEPVVSFGAGSPGLRAQTIKKVLEDKGVGGVLPLDQTIEFRLQPDGSYVAERAEIAGQLRDVLNRAAASYPSSHGRRPKKIIFQGMENLSTETPGMAMHLSTDEALIVLDSKRLSYLRNTDKPPLQLLELLLHEITHVLAPDAIGNFEIPTVYYSIVNIVGEALWQAGRTLSGEFSVDVIWEALKSLNRGNLRREMSDLRDSLEAVFNTGNGGNILILNLPNLRSHIFNLIEKKPAWKQSEKIEMEVYLGTLGLSEADAHRLATRLTLTGPRLMPEVPPAGDTSIQRLAELLSKAAQDSPTTLVVHTGAAPGRIFSCYWISGPVNEKHYVNEVELSRLIDQGWMRDAALWREYHLEIPAGATPETIAGYLQSKELSGKATADRKEWKKILVDYRNLIQAAGSDSELKRVYRRMAKEVHPDKNPGQEDQAAAVFKALANDIASKANKQFDVNPHHWDRDSYQGNDWVGQWAAGAYAQDNDNLMGEAIKNLKKREKIVMSESGPRFSSLSVAFESIAPQLKFQDIELMLDQTDSKSLADLLRARFSVPLKQFSNDDLWQSRGILEKLWRAWTLGRGDLLYVRRGPMIKRMIILKPVNRTTGAIELMEISAPFGLFMMDLPKSGVLQVSLSELALPEVDLEREPLQHGWSINIGNHLEIDFKGKKIPVTVIAAYAGYYTLIAWQRLHDDLENYSGRGLIYGKWEATEKLAEEKIKQLPANTPEALAETLRGEGNLSKSALHSIHPLQPSMGPAQEIVDRVDDDNRVIGQIGKDDAHKTGAQHRGVTVLLVAPDGRVMFQRRAPNKKAFADRLDVSVGGHVKAGMTYEDTARAEITEESPVPIDFSRLEPVKVEGGFFKADVKDPAIGHNRELKRVYMVRLTSKEVDQIEQANAENRRFWESYSPELAKSFTPQQIGIIHEKALALHPDLNQLPASDRQKVLLEAEAYFEVAGYEFMTLEGARQRYAANPDEFADGYFSLFEHTYPNGERNPRFENYVQAIQTALLDLNVQPNPPTKELSTVVVAAFMIFGASLVTGAFLGFALAWIFKPQWFRRIMRRIPHIQLNMRPLTFQHQALFQKAA